MYVFVPPPTGRAIPLQMYWMYVHVCISPPTGIVVYNSTGVLECTCTGWVCTAYPPYNSTGVLRCTVCVCTIIVFVPTPTGMAAYMGLPQGVM